MASMRAIVECRNVVDEQPKAVLECPADKPEAMLRIASLPWRDLALGALAVLGLDRVLAAMSPGFSLWKAASGIFATATSDQGGGSGLAYIFSGVHLRDLLDEQYLIGPLGAVFFVPAVFHSFNRLRRDFSAAFLALTGLVVLLACWITAEPALGYARDWDLFSPVGIVFTVGGLYFLLPRSEYLRCATNCSSARSLCPRCTWGLGLGWIIRRRARWSASRRGRQPTRWPT